MWGLFFRVFSIASLTTLINNVHDGLQNFFGTDEEGKERSFLLSPFMLMLYAAGIVLFLYNLIGKKLPK
jgi:hypothetical protein